MRTVFFIALRYLFAKKSHNVINIISLISVAGVMVGTAGLIIVLSVFNGFSGLVVSLYNSFDPDLKVTPVMGKTFMVDSILIDKMKNIEGVNAVSLSLEENALIKYGQRQSIVTIKGVDDHFFMIAHMDDKIIDGKLQLQSGDVNYAIVGGGIAYNLTLGSESPFQPLAVYLPKKGKPVSVTSPEEAFNTGLIQASGIFAIQQDFDNKYVLVPLRFARYMTETSDKISSIEIGLKPGYNENLIREKIQSLAGNNLAVKTRLEQHDFLYRILKTEKWAVYFILSFILIIAIFNITGSLTMLIIEKQKDIAIIRSLGAQDSLLRNIFLTEGLMITLAGALTGLFIGGMVCWFQQTFGLIRLDDGESFIVEAYPVAMEFADFVYVTAIVGTIGYLAAWYTSRKIAREKRISIT
jgi:lipoprotein-releasing system permease protein